MVTDHRATVDENVVAETDMGGDQRSRAHDGPFAEDGSWRDAGGRMDKRCERHAQCVGLVAKSATMRGREAAYGLVSARQIGDVIDPQDRQSLESLIAPLAVHVFDEAGHTEARNLRNQIGNLDS